jgi:glycosyltransferase involved in cell wall biosynthesis
VVVLTDGMRQALVEKGIAPGKIDVIPMWAEPELEPAPADAAVRARLGAADGELLVLFTGNLGVTARLEPFIDAILMVSDRPVRFCFVGARGIHAPLLRERLGALASVSFLPFQPEDELGRIIASADAAVVTLAPGLERLVVPSRAFPMLAAGLPLLAVMSEASELGELVGSFGAGVCTTDPREIAGTLLRWQSDPVALSDAAHAARTAYLTTGSRATLIQRYVDLVRNSGGMRVFESQETHGRVSHGDTSGS